MRTALRGISTYAAGGNVCCAQRDFGQTHLMHHSCMCRGAVNAYFSYLQVLRLMGGKSILRIGYRPSGDNAAKELIGRAGGRHRGIYRQSSRNTAGLIWIHQIVGISLRGHFRYGRQVAG